MRRLAALPAPVLAAVAIVSFVQLALPRARGAEGVFAGALLALVAAAALGPALFRPVPKAGRFVPAKNAAADALVLAVAFAGSLVALALWNGAPAGPALLAGLFCGLFAFTLGAVAYAAGGGLLNVLVPAVGLALLATLFVWDDLFLRGAADRKASVALAFGINPAAAASITLGVDWIHCKALYTNNQTAESLLGVRMAGLSTYAWKLLLVAAAAVPAGSWRKA